MAIKQLGPDASGANDAVRKSELDAAVAGGGGGSTFVVLSADVINNNATANTLQDVTGLSFAVNANTRYWFKFLIPYTSAASTTGSRWTINGPSYALLAYFSRYAASANSQNINYPNGYNLPATASAASQLAGNVAEIEGIITPSVSGTVIARFASEIANSAITAKAGGFVEYRIV